MFTGADDVNIDKDGAGELFQFYLDWYLLSYEYQVHFSSLQISLQIIAFFLQRHLQMIIIFFCIFLT